MTLPHKPGHLVAPIKRDGSLFAYTDDGKTIQLWDVATCLPVAQLKGHSARVSVVVFSPDKMLIVSGDEQGVIIIWMHIHTFPSRSLLFGGKSPPCFSPSATAIVTSSSDYSLLRWDSGKSQLVGEPWRGHQGPIVSIVFQTDGQVLSLSKDRTICTWDFESGQQKRGPI
ncbi:WD40-repeat-containing domain protein, partial [Collybia nuda]